MMFFFVSTHLFSQTIDYKGLSKEIEQNNLVLDYKSSIIKLHRIISDEKSENIDKSNAYYLKYQLFKRLAIYSEALENLEEAFLYGVESKRKDEIIRRYGLEKAVTYCEKLEYKRAIDELDSLKINQTQLEGKDLGLYLFLKGIESLEGKLVYQEAVEYFLESIAILKQDYPQYLPVVYKELLRAYAFLGNHNQVLDSYHNGVAYAEQFQWNSELIQLHRFIAIYYKQIGEVKKSLETSRLVLVLATKFDTVNLSSSLNILEKQLLEEDASLNRKRYIQRILQVFLGGVLIITGAYFVKFRRNINKQKSITEENERLRRDYESLITKEEVSRVDEESVLTDRQKEIVVLIRQGKTNKEIANELFVSENTVKYHLKIIYEVLNIKGKTDLLK